MPARGLILALAWLLAAPVLAAQWPGDEWAVHRIDPVLDAQVDTAFAEAAPAPGTDATRRGTPHGAEYRQFVCGATGKHVPFIRPRRAAYTEALRSAVPKGGRVYITP